MGETHTTPQQPSQRDRLADHLRQWGGITPEGAQRLGIGQVRTRVLELRRRGWRIATSHWPDPLRGGTQRGYTLQQAPDEEARDQDLGL